MVRQLRNDANELMVHGCASVGMDFGEDAPVVPEDMQPANLRDVHDATREMIAEDGIAESASSGVHVPRTAQAPRVARLGAIKTGRLVGMLLVLGLVIGGGAYWYVNYYDVKDEAPVSDDEKLPEVSPVLAGDYRAASDRAIERVRPTPEADATQPLIQRSQPTIDLSRLLARNSQQTGTNSNFNLLAPEEAPALPDNVLPTVTEKDESGNVGVKLPGDRVDSRMALSPEAYPASGEEPIYYWNALRNQLTLKNQPGESEGSQIDLEKAWILLSLYYNPQLDINEVRGNLRTLSRTLYSKMVEIGEDGETRLLGTERDRVRTVIDFMLQGDGSQLGWDVQEFHPGIRGMGTPPQDQNYLADEVFANGPKHRNAAANTALNILTLVLLRKLRFDLDSNDEQLDLNLPVYGMRLPDRTILRYDARGANAILLAGMSGEGDETRSPLDFEEGTKLELDYRGYTRNIEFIRNGNHYDVEDYQRRYQISENDGKKGVYLRTLSDRRMFASLGYELAQADIARARMLSPTDPAQAEILYDRAQRMLNEWVLDRDDGSAEGQIRKRRYASDHPQPRGDLLLRDAQILLAELYLQRADYPAIRGLIEDDHGLSTDGQRAQILQGMLKNIRGALNGARASFEEVMKFDEKNPFANLYLGEFDFLTADASLPAIYQWRPLSAFASDSAMSMMDRNYDIDHLASAIRYFDAAEANDMGRLNGEQRFLLHLHRALAHEQRGNLTNALSDLERVGEIRPDYKRSPSFGNIQKRLRYGRIFEVLNGPNSEASGQLKYDAVAFLDRNLGLGRDQQVEIERSVNALGMIDNLAVQWELVKVFKRISEPARLRQAEQLKGAERTLCIEGFGRDEAAWRRWFADYYRNNP